MAATGNEPELSDLDFTDTVTVRGAVRDEAVDPTDRVLAQLDALIDAIALKVAVGSTDERLWRVLAGMYMALERATDYSDLVRKHLSVFGRPLKLDQPGVTFALPAKLNADDIPALDLIRRASASPGGATIDFSAVRRVSSGGLMILSELLLALALTSVLPQLRGIEAFMRDIEMVVDAGQGSQEMQELVVAYRRFRLAHPVQAVPCAAAVA